MFFEKKSFSKIFFSKKVLKKIFFEKSFFLKLSDLQMFDFSYKYLKQNIYVFCKIEFLKCYEQVDNNDVVEKIIFNLNKFHIYRPILFHWLEMWDEVSLLCSHKFDLFVHAWHDKFLSKMLALKIDVQHGHAPLIHLHP